MILRTTEPRPFSDMVWPGWMGRAFRSWAGYKLPYPKKSTAPSGTSSDSGYKLPYPESELVPLGAVDFFGYGNLYPAQLRKALPIQPGQTMSEKGRGSVVRKIIRVNDVYSR